jgi:NAD dependent epimerase/dehydratase family enzyme
MPEKVLITGANGLIGSRLASLLVTRSTEVNVLGRKKLKKLASFTWDLVKASFDKAALEGVSAIIRFAGARTAQKRDLYFCFKNV